MSKSPKTLEEIEHDELAFEPPRMTVLSDRPLRADDSHLDSLGLAIKLGPIYDILRHTETRTPLAVAIYGDWGSGKTSAMKWLEGLLHRWNSDRSKHGPKDEPLGKVVRPVWFYPWKYHSKDDVWRGLIAEVILASIAIRGASKGRVLKALKQFGGFLGRSFLRVLERFELIDGADIVDDIAAEYQRSTHPEAAYLNQFETTLRTWVRETISVVGERMVIFIDDLDRCMPEVALQVLEALKLYLNIEDLVFVVGVDRSVVDQLLQKLYDRQGLQADKSKYYLAKMFQVEVTIGPSERQAEMFLERQLTEIGQHTDEYWNTKLDDRERDIFRHVLLSLAQRNPREIKRLLNSVLIHGAGVRYVERQPFSFAQGMQVYLVRRILDERYTMGLTVDTRSGMMFLHSWSDIVRSGGAATVPHPVELAESLSEGGQPPEQAVAYLPLLTAQRFAHLRQLLADRDLGRLMAIAYPADTSALAATTMRQLPDGLIREAIARQLGKQPGRITPKDYALIRQFEMHEDISDISALQAFTELANVDLTFTDVDDIRPLAALSKLRVLHLTSTDVSQLSPLRNLRELRQLSLDETPVEDLRPLASLTALRSLKLRATRVSDVSPLAGLHELEVLGLAGTQVSDVSPLHGLTALLELDLRNCPVGADAVAALRAALPDTTIYSS